MLGLLQGRLSRVFLPGAGKLKKIVNILKYIFQAALLPLHWA